MRKEVSREQTFRELREAEVLICKTKKVELVIPTQGVSDVMYYQWRKEHGRIQGGGDKETQWRGEDPPLPLQETLTLRHVYRKFAVLKQMAGKLLSQP